MQALACGLTGALQFSTGSSRRKLSKANLRRLNPPGEHGVESTQFELLHSLCVRVAAGERQDSPGWTERATARFFRALRFPVEG